MRSKIVLAKSALQSWKRHPQVKIFILIDFPSFSTSNLASQSHFFDAAKIAFSIFRNKRMTIESTVYFSTLRQKIHFFHSARARRNEKTIQKPPFMSLSSLSHTDVDDFFLLQLNATNNFLSDKCATFPTSPFGALAFVPPSFSADSNGAGFATSNGEDTFEQFLARHASFNAPPLSVSASSQGQGQDQGHCHAQQLQLQQQQTQLDLLDFGVPDAASPSHLLGLEQGFTLAHDQHDGSKPVLSAAPLHPHPQQQQQHLGQERAVSVSAVPTSPVDYATASSVASSLAATATPTPMSSFAAASALAPAPALAAQEEEEESEYEDEEDEEEDEDGEGDDDDEYRGASAKRSKLTSTTRRGGRSRPAAAAAAACASESDESHLLTVSAPSASRMVPFDMQNGRRIQVPLSMMEKKAKLFFQYFEKTFHPSKADMSAMKLLRRKHQLRKSSQKGRREQKIKNECMVAELERLSSTTASDVLHIVRACVSRHVPAAARAGLLAEVSAALQDHFRTADSA
eukprot:m.157607 g.157607  ORF g.157607 m.157607 type:complete len:515 (-) comp15166_c1_seq3:866-2410(-)